MQAFRGATESIIDSINAWSDAGRTFKAALVTQINETPSASWRFLSEFLANNTLIPDQVQPELTGRILTPYDTVNNGSSLKFTDEAVFGNPTGGQTVTGVVVYQDTGDPASSILYSYDDNPQQFPASTLGGQTRWGSAGPNNEILTWPAQQTFVATLAGALRDLHELPDPFSPDSAYTFALRLVLAGGTIVPNSDWETMADLTSAGVLFATVSADVLLPPNPGSPRVGKIWQNGTIKQEQFRVNPGGTPFTWSTVPAAQDLAAVVMYRNTGNDATSRAWHWDGAFTQITTSGGNVTYGNGTEQVINYGQH